MSDHADSRPMIDPHAQRRRRLVIASAITLTVIVLVILHLVD